jgi:glycosyltransferase involved in cell wall biosynthesis
MFDKSLSVVLPVYNEEDNIYDVIKPVFDTLSSITSDFEIIAVDDGSVDGTAKILEELQSSNTRLKVIRHPENKGYGATLASGFKKAEKELIFVMDADRQFNIAEFTKFLPYIEDYDIVAGFRTKRRDPLYRCILGTCFNFIVRILFGIKIKDINCGFKLYKRDLPQRMDLVTAGALINTEILALAQRNKAKIKEVGINHYPRIYGKQTGGSLKVILKAILEALRLRWRLLIKK